MYKIGELSQLSQVPISTLRYYDQIGVLVPARAWLGRAGLEVAGPERELFLRGSPSLTRSSSDRARRPEGIDMIASRMLEHPLAPLFTIQIRLHAVQELGATPLGRRRIVPVAGGEFAGERLRGTVLPHAGSDWLLERGDGSFQQDARLTLETDDGAVIAMSYRGVRHGSAEVAARLARGEPVAPTEYYLRTAPFFESASQRYSWLNRIVAVGVGRRVADGVVYDVFEVL